MDKFDFFTNKNVKYLFYKFNDYLLFRNLPTVPVRHSKIAENKIILKKVQNSDWKYLVVSVIKLVENDRSHLKPPLPKNEEKKSMKHNYKVARRVYGSIYTNIAEQFKIYVNSLLPDEIDEIENNFRANGNGLLSVRDAASATELFDSFVMFYYINGRLPYTDGHLFVPDGEIPPVIQGENLNLKELFPKFFLTKSNGLVSAPFLAALLLFFSEKESLVKNFLAELYRNLTVEALSSDNDSLFEFQALTDLCAEINVRLANSISANHERARLGMKKQDEDISKKYDFFDDDDDDDDDKNFPDDISIKQESDFPDNVSIKQESDNEIDDRETIPYASPKRKSDNEIDEKI